MVNLRIQGFKEGIFGSLYVYLNNAVRGSDDDLTATVTTEDGYTATVDLEQPYPYYRDYYYGEVESSNWKQTESTDPNPNPGEGMPVYVYVQITGDIPEDLELNSHGWYTIGRITINGLPDPSSERNVLDSYQNQVLSALKRIDRYEPNTGFLYVYLFWKSLHGVSNGADDYVSEAVWTWHLDGQIDINELERYDVTYLSQAGDAAPFRHFEVISGTEHQIISDVPSREGYEFLGWKLENGPDTLYEAGDTIPNVTSDITLIAQWRGIGDLTVTKTVSGLTGNDQLPNSFQIEVTGGSLGSGKTLTVSTADKTETPDGTTTYSWTLDGLGEGTYTATESNFAVEGYTVSTEGSITSAKLEPGSNGTISLTNTYTADATINYVAVPENGGSVSLPRETVPAGSSAQGSTATAKDGWYFAGWYGNKECTGTPLSTDATYVPKTADAATYYAKFAEKTDVTITITGNSDTLEYNGQSQSVTGYDYEVNVENVIDDVSYTSDAKPSATGTNAGTYNMGLSADNFTYTFANPADEGKYEVTVKVVDGKLEITPKDVTIIAASDSKPYDGAALTNGTYAVVDGTYTEAPEGATYSTSGVEIIAGELITATVTGSQTNAGTSDNVASNATVTNGNASNYNFHYVNGTLTVNKASVTITVTGNTKTETYDGTEKTVEDFTVTGNPTGTTVALAEGETAKATGVNVNTYYMGLDENSFVLEGDTAENYAVTWNVTDGWLQIVDNATLTVSAPDVATTYDGAVHPVMPIASVDGATITVTYTDTDGNTITGEPFDAGTYTATIEATLSGYETATSTATVTITPATLTVTTPSASKVYDGTPLTATEGSVSGLVPGETVTLTVTGSQTGIGSSQNVYSLDWNGTAKQSNYTIVENLGTLTVTPATGVTVAKEATAAPVGGYVAGDTITWTITVTNTGTETVHGLSLADSIQDVVLSGPDGVNPADFDLDPNESVEFTATLANAPAGTYTNYVTVSQNGTDLGNAPADPVIVTGQAPHLTVSKEADKDTAQVGDTVNYTITVANTGNVPLNNVTVTDTFTGAGVLTFTDSTAYTVNNNGDGTYTITIGNMAKGASVTITATYIVLEADASNNTITNTAAANADGLDDTPPATGNCNCLWPVHPDLRRQRRQL